VDSDRGRPLVLILPVALRAVQPRVVPRPGLVDRHGRPWESLLHARSNNTQMGRDSAPAERND